MKTKITIELETKNMKPLVDEGLAHSEEYAKLRINKKWMDEHNGAKQVELGLHAEFVTQVKKFVEEDLDAEIMDSCDREDICCEDYDSVFEYGDVSIKSDAIERDNTWKSRATVLREEFKAKREKEKAEIRKVVLPDIDVLIGKKDNVRVKKNGKK